MSDQIGGVSVGVSALLQAWGRGDLRARDQLTPLVYGELRRRAAAYLRHERPHHTLQPTALVHEAYVRLGSRCTRLKAQGTSLVRGRHP
jgi:hypothetical protein